MKNKKDWNLIEYTSSWYMLTMLL